MADKINAMLAKRMSLVEIADELNRGKVGFAQTEKQKGTATGLASLGGDLRATTFGRADESRHRVRGQPVRVTLG